MEMKIIIGYCQIIFPATKQLSNTYTQMYSLKFTALLKKEVSTSKVTFTSCLKPTRTKNSWKVQWGKNPANYETIRKETNIYEQKPVNIDDFNKSEEAEVKEWVEKQKEKRPIQGWKKQTVEKKKEQVKQN